MYRCLTSFDVDTVFYMTVYTYLDLPPCHFQSTVTFSLPHVTNKATQLLGYDIPEGAIIIANLYSAHIDGKYWKDPHEFIPERFLDDNGKLRRRDAFVPFSAGNVNKRHCFFSDLLVEADPFPNLSLFFSGLCYWNIPRYFLDFAYV